jgi:tRNA threonylcarbamoyladenosine biosynthesis protein TsaB
MRLLALDTTTEACSVALLNGEAVAERHSVEPRAHTRILLPMIRQLLGEAGLGPGELDAVVLGNGPGSFIGMRISASVAQGLCFAAGLPLVPVSSLAAVAAELMERDGIKKVAVAQDARMGEVYFATYRRDDRGLPAALNAEAIVPVGRPGILQGTGWIAAGGGWKRYPQLADGCATAISNFSALEHPRARFLLGIGAAAIADGQSIDAEQLQPAYLRVKVAEPMAGAQR